MELERTKAVYTYRTATTITNVLSYMTITEYKYLSLEQRKQFLDQGWVRIPKAVPPENIARFTEDVWIRLGYDPDDKSTWTKEKVRRQPVPGPKRELNMH